METLVECVPNVSEGRRPEVIGRLAATVEATGIHVLDLHSDPDHNRSVITFVGTAAAVEAAALRLAGAAQREIDLRIHRGVHPRIGALDVLPFVPLGSTPMRVCVDLAHRVGDAIATRLGIPVYFYGEAALRPERRVLVNIRRGEFEVLQRTILTDPARTPDRGPAVLGAAGATAIGARKALVAFNVLLRTGDRRIAEAVARQVRASSGGLPGVQALGFALQRPDVTQVSMNLTDLEQTPVHVAHAAVRAAAAAFGVEVGESELVGLIPAEAALRSAAAELGLPGLERRQVLDLALYDAR